MTTVLNFLKKLLLIGIIMNTVFMNFLLGAGVNPLLANWMLPYSDVNSNEQDPSVMQTNPVVVNLQEQPEVKPLKIVKTTEELQSLIRGVEEGAIEMTQWEKSSFLNSPIIRHFKDTEFFKDLVWPYTYCSDIDKFKIRKGEDTDYFGTDISTHIDSNGYVCLYLATCVDTRRGYGIRYGKDGTGSCAKWPGKIPDLLTNSEDSIQCQPSVSKDFTMPRMTDEEVCSIDQWKVKECADAQERLEMLSLSLADGKPSLLTDYSLRFIEDTGSIKDYRCVGDECSEDSCSIGSCKGDEIFCKKFGCTGTIDCTCEARKNSTSFKIHHFDEDFAPSCLIQGKFKVTRKREIVQHIVRETQCTSCSVHCNSDGMVLQLNSQKAYLIKLCKNPFCSFYNFSGYDTQLKVPQEYLLTSSEIKVSIFEQGHEVPWEVRVQCPLKGRCETIECFLCWDHFWNWQCYTIASWIGLILLILTAIVMGILLASILWMMRIAYNLWRFGSFAVKGMYKVTLYPFHLFRRKWATIPANEDLEMNVRTVASAPTLAEINVDSGNEVRRTPLFYRKSVIAPLLLISLMIQGIESCSESNIMSIRSEDCITDITGTTNCKTKINSRMALSPIGQTSCLNILNSDKKTIGALEIKTNSLDIVCKKERLYYIPDVQHDCYSYKRCFRAGTCNDEHCNNFKTTDLPDYFSSDKPTLGWSGCSRVSSSGWAGEGCFFNSRDGCLYWRKFLKNPQGKVAELFECNDWSYRAELQVSFLHPNGSKTEKSLVITPSISKKWSSEQDFYFSLISVSVPPMPLLNKCFLKRDTGIYLVECNRRTEYTLGKFGEIQCGTKDQAINLVGCNTSPNIIDLRAMQLGAECSSNMLSFTMIDDKYRLPLKTQSGLILPEGEDIVAQVTSSGQLEMNVKSSSFSVQSKRDDNKCFAKFEKLEGCYSCLTGAELTLSAYTDFGTGIATLNCPSLITPLSFPVQPLQKSHTFVVQIPQSKVDLECSVVCSNNEMKMKVKGELFYDKPEIYQNHSISFTPSINNSTGWDVDDWSFLNPFNIFKNLNWDGWMHTVILTAIALFCILTVGIKLLAKLKNL